jgi:uncharacterized protein (TIGR00369 family)
MAQFEKLQAAKDSGDYRAIVDQIPYAVLLGIVMREDSSPETSLLFVLPFAEKNIGNVHLPALHGGVIGGFLETAAQLQLVWARESADVPRTVDFSVDYLRSAKSQTLFARCDITRQGKRVAHVRMSSWQDDSAKPVAVARAHFLLS